ncbi:hypothetical protein XU18_3199 [Perkinsela sp. CCAP 1560/4]|nr:hypothetical protein XU18_3199 [Perkinsela sp. CCAP 1560/4]|eukprot:KNH05838.1 hypothetical protein XU18_3199 [Perkinsela sp. CCAP 1560/4]
MGMNTLPKSKVPYRTGRFDKSTLSQPSLMEHFLCGFDNIDNIRGSRDDPRGVRTRRGVRCNTDGEVEKVSLVFQFADGTGTVGFKCLPTSMKHLEMSPNEGQSNLQISQKI